MIFGATEDYYTKLYHKFHSINTFTSDIEIICTLTCLRMESRQVQSFHLSGRASTVTNPAYLFVGDNHAYKYLLPCSYLGKGQPRTALVVSVREALPFAQAHFLDLHSFNTSDKMVENGKPDEEAVVANNEAEDYFPTNGEGSTDSPSQKNHVSGSTTSAGTALDMRLSKVSQAYDRGNKGYLDSTELTLRQMDTDNKGHLDVDKVYALMQEFKQEQKKTMTFKRVIIALCVFALLLALANIGTSFAAATLAKDTKVSPDGNLAAASSERTVGTIAKHNGYKATQNLSGDANQTLSRLLQTNSNATQAGDRFYTTKADTDALFEDICNEWLDGGMASWDGSTVGCATGADYVTLSHW